MAKNFKEIKQELEKRGFRDIRREDVNFWAIVFALEEMTSELKRSFVVKGK